MSRQVDVQVHLPVGPGRRSVPIPHAHSCSGCLRSGGPGGCPCKGKSASAPRLTATVQRR
eukprot:6485843-Alexandrium_andersonii.AAC.1